MIEHSENLHCEFIVELWHEIVNHKKHSSTTTESC